MRIPVGPLIIASGLALAPAILAAFRRSSSPRLRRLAEPLAGIPHGPHAKWRREDHRRALLLGGYGLVAGWAIGLALMSAGDQWRLGTRQNSAFSFAGLIFCFAGLAAGWWGLSHLRGALRKDRPGAAAAASDLSASNAEHRVSGARYPVSEPRQPAADA